MSVLDMRTRNGSEFGYAIAYHLEQQCGYPAGEGGTFIQTSDLATIVGVDLAEMGAEMARQGDDFTVPDTWIAAGRRRVAQAEAAGATGVGEIVAYLRSAA